MTRMTGMTSMTVWQSPAFDGHEHVSFFRDDRAGLRAVVAVHSTALGPAAGGTRMWDYASDADALDDALRLSRAMSFKNALGGIPFGGGKAVIVGDPARDKTPALLHAFGRFLNRIGSTFSTAEDVGITVADCEIMRQVSPYVSGTDSGGAGDPSVHTARGVMHGLAAVVRARLGRAGLNGVHVTVQGLGNVGMRLCRLLAEAGARLTVADVRAERADEARRALGATVVGVDEVLRVEADVFAPCALGGVVHAGNVDDLRVAAVAGGANNPLAGPEIDEALARRGILFAPDFVINAGGILGAVEELARVPGRAVVAGTVPPLDVRLARIEDRLTEVFTRATSDKATPSATALRMAREVIAAAASRPAS